jgi:murein DD-endopeptidase MepM/ murein hydrolase activator NlpD
MTKSAKHGSWQLSNPLPVDIQHWLRVKGQKTFFTSLLTKSGQTIILDPSDYGLADNLQPIEHYYLLGKPVPKPDEQVIPLPYISGKKFKISQGFNGKYSHGGRGNRFAVDIAMPIGAKVSAVRSGVVADLRDDFSIGGPTNYFLDKANHVTVMHDDGTTAIYAHILYGSAQVKIGDRVNVGDVLARVGNTGFSTGPHLHFVMRYNSGNGSYSIPFRFTTAAGIKLPLEGKVYKAQ